MARRIGKSNNYSQLEQSFLRQTGIDLVSGSWNGRSVRQGASVIIPVSNNYPEFAACFTALQAQIINPIAARRTEIIVIDDGSKNPQKIKAIIARQRRFSTTLIRLKTNCGRAVARNAGLAFAKQPIIVFLDSDMIPNQRFLINHIMRHEILPNIAVIGFRDTIVSRQITKDVRARIARPSYKNDFRYKKYILPEWRTNFPQANNEVFGADISVLKESHNFKDFTANSMVGVWTLPFMLLTSNCSVRRSHTLKAGGLSEQFTGWGLEDTYFGYKLLQLGIFFVPIHTVTAIHITRPETVAEKRLKQQNFIHNLKLYNKLILQRTKLPASGQSWKRGWLNQHAGIFQKTVYPNNKDK